MFVLNRWSLKKNRKTFTLCTVHIPQRHERELNPKFLGSASSQRNPSLPGMERIQIFHSLYFLSVFFIGKVCFPVPLFIQFFSVLLLEVGWLCYSPSNHPTYHSYTPYFLKVEECVSKVFRFHVEWNFNKVVYIITNGAERCQDEWLCSYLTEMLYTKPICPFDQPSNPTERKYEQLFTIENNSI